MTQANDTEQAQFYKNPMPISLDRHRQSSFVPAHDSSFAQETNSIVLNAGEFIEAAKHYPIVFTQNNAAPVAIVGLESSNYFVEKDGSWKTGAYVPAYVRKYPFIFMEIKEQNSLLLCIDENSKGFSLEGDKNGQAFYNEDDQPTEIIQSALNFCNLYHQHHLATVEFCNALQAENLLVPNTTTLTLLEGQRQISLGGFLMIDEKKFAELPDEKILEFHKKGWLALIHFVLMSVSNWRSLANLATAK